MLSKVTDGALNDNSFYKEKPMFFFCIVEGLSYENLLYSFANKPCLKCVTVCIAHEGKTLTGMVK